MKIELICTGEEVLCGQIVDTNAAWLAQYLWDQGLALHRKNTIGDRREDLTALFLERSTEADLVIVNGGLGPTTDDLSTEAMAMALQEPLVLCEVWQKKMDDFFAQRQIAVPACNTKQAMLPQSARMIDNPYGTACGFAVKLNRAWFFFTPGVPREFKPMIKEQLLPFVKQNFTQSISNILKKFLVFGHGESFLQEKLSAIQNDESISLGYRAFSPYIELKLIGPQSAAKQLSAFEHTMTQQLGDMIVGQECTSLAEVVHQQLKQHHKTLSLAESCTGGLLASQLIRFAGSSAYFKEGVIAYDAHAKKERLGVRPHILQEEGEVSLMTAAQMAEGIRRLSQSDYALSTTGIAGPDGGNEDKPVGTVCIALATPTHSYIQKVYFKNRSRDAVREFSAAVAFDMLRRILQNKEPCTTYSSIEQVATQVMNSSDIFAV
tara:strand:- start:167 stop:1471 length:1305 start_codon:yes stop_codon:yes gene_type:complete